MPNLEGRRELVGRVWRGTLYSGHFLPLEQMDTCVNLDSRHVLVYVTGVSVTGAGPLPRNSGMVPQLILGSEALCSQLQNGGDNSYFPSYTSQGQQSPEWCLVHSRRSMDAQDWSGAYCGACCPQARVDQAAVHKLHLLHPEAGPEGTGEWG